MGTEENGGTAGKRGGAHPDGKCEGLQMVLVGCPIADFAKKHGYMDLMPAMD